MRWVAALLSVWVISAQTAPKHLNPVIEKLAAGKPFVGVQTGDLSLENARSLARADTYGLPCRSIQCSLPSGQMTRASNARSVPVANACVTSARTRSRSSGCMCA